MEDGKIRIVASGNDVDSLKSRSGRVNITNVVTLQNRREVLARFHAGYKETLDWMCADPAALKIFSEFTGLPERVVSKVRELVPKEALAPDRIVGVTCHDSRHMAIEASEAGADYVAFGAFFPTNTKEAKTHADIELLSWWSEVMVVPSVAIGGITVDNARPLVEAGADFIAVSAGVWSYSQGPAAAIRAFNALF